MGFLPVILMGVYSCKHHAIYYSTHTHTVYDVNIGEATHPVPVLSIMYRQTFLRETILAQGHQAFPPKYQHNAVA